MKKPVNALATLILMIAFITQFTSIDKDTTILLLWVSVIVINISRIKGE